MDECNTRASRLAGRPSRRSANGRWTTEGRSRATSFRSFAPVLFALASVVVVQLASSGCSTRSETPAVAADSTLVYRAKDPGGLEASITLCSKSPSKKTGKRRGVSEVFTADEDAKVYAFVDLENHFALGNRLLEFHIVWIGPDGTSFYKKRVEYVPTDSTVTLQSRISIPPERRDPGRYALRVYFFRELIAERDFEVVHKT